MSEVDKKSENTIKEYIALHTGTQYHSKLKIYKTLKMSNLDAELQVGTSMSSLNIQQTATSFPPDIRGTKLIIFLTVPHYILCAPNGLTDFNQISEKQYLMASRKTQVILISSRNSNTISRNFSIIL